MACSAHVEKGDTVAVSVGVEQLGADGSWSIGITRGTVLQGLQTGKQTKPHVPSYSFNVQDNFEMVLWCWSFSGKLDIFPPGRAFQYFPSSSIQETQLFGVYFFYSTAPLCLQ